jgi:hypothetical protein
MPAGRVAIPDAGSVEIAAVAAAATLVAAAVVVLVPRAATVAIPPVAVVAAAMGTTLIWLGDALRRRRTSSRPERGAVRYV